MQTGSKKPKSILTIDKRAIVHHRSYLFTFVFLLFVLAVETACSSNAKIQVQALDRTAMQDKINTIEGGIDASNSYKELTAKLSEEERDSLNLLLGRVIDRSPSKADKKATVTSILASIESVRKETTLQGKVKSAIDSLVFVSATFDASLRAFSDALQFSPVDSKLSYLALAEGVSKSASNDANILNAFESGLPSLGGEVVFVSSAGWNKIPSESALAAEFVSTLLKIASTTRSRDLESFLVRASDGKIQSKILEGLRGVSGTDAQIGNIVKVQNIVPEESLTVFNTLVALYSTNTTPAELKNSTIEALKKGLVLRSPLLTSYFKELQSLSTQTDSNLLINSLVDSIDKTSGEAYFSQPKFTTKSISPYTVPGCTLPGASTTKVTYSFKWAKNGSTLIDWTTQSFDRLASAGSLFALEDTTQCYVRVFVDGSKVADLNTELITVRSMPPIFTSGEPPQPQTFSAPKNVGFVYKVADRDPITDTGVFYKIVGLAQHGVVTQSEIGTFDYKPLTSYIGTDEFKFVACNLDDMCSSEKVITLNIVDGNQPPRLDRIIAPTQNTTAGGIKMSSDSTLNNIQLIIEDDDVIGSSCGIPNVIITSGNTSRFPQSTSNIEVSGTFPYCKLKLAPAAGSAGLGTTTLTIKLDDGTNPQVTSTVDVTVLEKTPQWTTPATSTTFAINKNSGANTLYLNAATDADAGLFLTPQTLTYVIDSSPASGVGSLTGASAVPSSGNGTIVFTPTAGTSTTTDQSTTFTYKVCDNATPQNCTATKTVTVNVINNAPTISAIANPAAISEDSNTGAIAFTIADIDDNIACSSVSKASSNTSLIPAANIVIGGSGTSCNVTVTPVADGNGGPVAITLSLNHKSATIDRTFLVTVNAVNDSPALSATGATVGTASTPEETAVNVILQGATDVDTDPLINASPESLRYELVIAPAHGTLNTGNTVGVMSGVSTASIPLRTVTYTPAANYNGNDQFTYKICDSNGTSACTANVNVLFNVTALNDAPTMTDIAFQIGSENIATSALAFTIDDVDNTVQCSQVTASSSNTTLVPSLPLNLEIGGTTGTVCSITVTPVTNQNGTTVVTLTLNDGSGAGNAVLTKNFAVTFMPVNTPPSITGVPSSQIINEDSSTTAMSFTISDDDNPVQCSQVVASSNNTDLFPSSPVNLTIGGNAPDCTITVTPAANQNSFTTATITLTLNDGSGATNSTVQATFTVTVNEVNDAPTITDIAFQLRSEDSPTPALSFTIGDIDDTVECTDILATSTNTDLVPSANTYLNVVGTTGPACSIIVTPVANKNGSSTIRLTLNDGSGEANAEIFREFGITFTPENDRPSMPSTPANQTINEDTSTTALSFTIEDVDNTVRCSQVTALSNNTSLIPNGPVNLAIGGGDSTSCSITITPAANQSSATAATIELKLDDGSGATNSTIIQTFDVLVTSTNDAPTISAIANQTINEDSNTGALAFTIDDIEANVNCDNVTATSLLPSLIPDDSTALNVTGGASKNCAITATPLGNKNSTDNGGVATITLSLTDGTTTTQRQFTVNVLSVNDAPTLTGSAASGTQSEDNNLIIILGSGTDPDTSDTLTYNFVTLPQHGTLGTLPAANTGGNVTYTPQANYNGSDSFTYRICDQQNLCSSTVNSVNITITSTNDAPVLTASSSTTTMIQASQGGTQIALTLAGATDADGDTLTAKVVTLPTQGTLQGSPAVGVTISSPINYTPPTGQSGIFTLVYNLCDASNACSVNQTVHIEVLGRTPLLNTETTTNVYNIAENSGATTIDLDGATDPDAHLFSPAQTRTYTVEKVVNLGTLATPSAVPSSGTGTVSYTPTTDTSGVEQLRYKVCDDAATPNCSPFKYITINIGVTSGPVMIATGDSRKETNTDTAVAIELGRFVDLSDSSANLEYVYTMNGARVSSPSGKNPKSSTTTDRTVTYTPATAGTESFKYKVCRTTAPTICSVEHTAQFTVFGKTPQFNGSATTSVYSIAENAGATPISVDGATDPDAQLLGQTLSYTVVLETALGATGTLPAVPSDGTADIIYTPTANTSGVEILKYKVCDDATTPNCTAFKYITINIGLPDYPILMAAGDYTTTITAPDTTIDFVLGRFVDLGDSAADLEYVYTQNNGIRVSLPTGKLPKSSTTADRTVTYTPGAFTGTETFKYKVCRTASPTICSVEYVVELVSQ
jgi:hypothetical protein